ncbi:MAG: type II secretion system F family protein [Armatimonadota bacterium]|nr:type II secretion system F family protein [Armatimonadota bacterium]
MPTFNYTARDKQGRTIAGSMDATSDREVAGTLREQGLLPQRISTASQIARSEGLGDFLTRAFLPVSLGTRMFLFRQLATMLHAGMPVGQALSSIASHTRNKRICRALSEVHEHVVAGGKLSEAMRRYPWLFGDLELALIESGELAGGMDRAAAQAADYLEKQLEVRRKFSRATFYPKALLLAVILIPPLPALILDGFQAYLNAVLKTAVPLVLLSLTIWIVFRIALQSPGFARMWDGFKLGIPGIGGNVRKFALAKFARAAAVLYAAGAPMAQSVETAAAASGNRFVGKRLAATSSALRNGADLHSALSDSKVLTPLLEEMIATGQMTGNVDEMMNKIAEYYEAEAESGMDKLAVVIGIVAFLLVALYIGVTVIGGYSSLGGIYGREMGN